MQVELGAHVRSSDGQDAGHIDKIVVDTTRTMVSAIVLRRGGLLHKDIQAPLSELRASPDGELQLTYAADVIREMPAYVPPGSGGAADAALRADVAAMVAQYELEHAVIQAGSIVKGRDGKKCGAVHWLAFDLPGGRLTRLVLRQGLLVTEEVELPAALITAVGPGELVLSVTADEVAALARLQPGLDIYASDEVCLGSIVERHADYLEVSGPDGRHPLFVPLASVARVGADRVVLAADSGRAALWRTPPAAEAAELGPEAI